jgi:general stress protein YciG
LSNSKSPRGFAAMSKDEARAIQSEGGKNSPQNFKKNRALASRAGRAGGRRSRRTS